MVSWIYVNKLYFKRLNEEQKVPHDPDTFWLYHMVTILDVNSVHVAFLWKKSGVLKRFGICDGCRSKQIPCTDQMADFPRAHQFLSYNLMQVTWFIRSYVFFSPTLYISIGHRGEKLSYRHNSLQAKKNWSKEINIYEKLFYDLKALNKSIIIFWTKSRR